MTNKQKEEICWQHHLMITGTLMGVVMLNNDGIKLDMDAVSRIVESSDKHFKEAIDKVW